jgi:hypothetical protein
VLLATCAARLNDFVFFAHGYLDLFFGFRLRRN